MSSDKIVIAHENREIKYLCDYIAEFDTDYYENAYKNIDKPFYNALRAKFAAGKIAPHPMPSILAPYISNIETQLSAMIKSMPKITASRWKPEYNKQQSDMNDAATKIRESAEIQKIYMMDIMRFIETRPAELNILIGAETEYGDDYSNIDETGYDKFNIWIGNVFYGLNRFKSESGILGLSIDIANEKLREYLDYIKANCGGIKVKRIVFAYATLAYFYIRKPGNNKYGFISVLNMLYDLMDNGAYLYLEASSKEIINKDVNNDDDMFNLFTRCISSSKIDVSMCNETIYHKGFDYICEDVYRYGSLNFSDTGDEKMDMAANIDKIFENDAKKYKNGEYKYQMILKKLYRPQDNSIYYSKFLHAIIDETKFKFDGYYNLKEKPYPVFHMYSFAIHKSIKSKNNHYIVLQK